jgi:D-glycero-alpha-D-manno-heptose-7-phosphate kinase
MIISKTPYRISFFGGGTDFPEWYLGNGGNVLSSSIDKYCYINMRILPPFFQHKHRIVYSIVENITSIDEIKHPVVREVFKLMRINDGIEVHHNGDLPAKSGIGSSSSFTVGLLNALSNLYGKTLNQNELAKLAIKIERDILKENVGEQDQIAAAYGGFNNIRFSNKNDFRVTNLELKKDKVEELESKLLLFFTGISRNSSKIAKFQKDNIKNNNALLTEMSNLTNEAISILVNDGSSINEFGALLDINWRLKKGLSKHVSLNSINDIYDLAKENGALGGKILGAGGGGFFLIFADEIHHNKLKSLLNTWLHVPFKFSTKGSSVINTY